MTRQVSSLLSSPRPSAIAPAPGLHIAHVQLRDLVICPRERGLVNYVTRNSVVEQDLLSPRSTPRSLFNLSFSPANLSSLEVLDGGATLFAAGGQEAELHLSLHHHSTRSRRTGSLEWGFEEHLSASINNSILLTSLNLGRSNESSIEPRLAISNNDCTVKFFDVPMAVRSGTSKIRDVGSVKLDVAVNHSSVSPDGTCLLSVGDSSKIFLHRIYGGSQLSFSPIATLTVPPPDRNLLSYFSSSLAASFSTAFSRDGTKYAVASQEGVVCVWDVRSTKPLKVYQTDKSDDWTGISSGSGFGNGNGMASGYLSDDPYEWTRGLSRAPGWSARNVKFGSGGGDGRGKEIMTFTEHTSLLHVIDARTFETEEIIRVPSVSNQSSLSSGTTTRSKKSSQRSSTSSTQARSSRSSRTSSNLYIYQRPASNARALAAQRANGPSPRTTTVFPSSSSYPTSSSRRDHYQAPYVVLALEDTFRIPPPREGGTVSTSTSGSAEIRHDIMSMNTGAGTAEGDLVVIPPLGDRQVEDDIRALLGSHGLRSRRVGGAGVITHNRHRRREEDDWDGDREREEEEEDDMQVDDADSESCVPSRIPSRTSSPAPGAENRNRWRVWPRVEALSGVGGVGISVRGRGDERRGEGARARFEDGSADDDAEDEDEETRSGSASSITNAASSVTSPAELDIAGTCFDPSGGYIYVATAVPLHSYGSGYGHHHHHHHHNWVGSMLPPHGGADNDMDVDSESRISAGHGANGIGRAGLGGIVEWNVRGSGKRWWVDSVDSESGDMWR